MTFQIKNRKLNFKTKNAIIKEYPELENITITPNKEDQTFKSSEYYGYNEVKVNGIPDEYVIPTGEIEININGTYDVKDKEQAIVNVPEKQLGTKKITSNGVYKATEDGLDGYSEVEVATSGADLDEYFIMNEIETRASGQIKKLPSELYEALTYKNNNYYSSVSGYFRDLANLEEISFFESGNFNSFDNCFYGCYKLKTIPALDTASSTNMSSMFYSCNVLETIPLLNTSKVTNMSSMFQSCAKLQSVPLMDTSKVTNMSSMFSFCQQIKEIPAFNTEKVTNLYNTFAYCYELTSIEKLDFSSATAVNGIVSQSKKITYLGGFENVGKAYLTTQSANYSSYTLDISGLTELDEQSIINVLLGLFDIATKGCKTQKCTIGATNLAKLTSEAGQQALAQAQSYGWTIS